MSFRVVVDSCCDLTPSMRQSGVFVTVPLTIQVEDHTVVDDATFDQADLLRRMRESKTGPKSACPSPALYLDAFGEGFDEVYVVTLSAMLSGSHNAAAQARAIYLEEHPSAHIHIFNSCSASAGEVLTALKIKDLAEGGADFNTVIRETSRYISEMQTLFVLENLDNLRKNGRLTKTQAIITGTLRIKLLMGSTPEGEICKRGQALSIKQALSKMASLMAADKGHQGRTLCIAHCNCADRALYLRELVGKLCHFRDVLLCETGGISTFYANDGGVVVAY